MFSMETLKEWDPSYVEVAKLMEMVRIILGQLISEIDPTLTDQAVDYCRIMTKMGDAIHSGDQEALDILVEELSKKPFSMAAFSD